MTLTRRVATVLLVGLLVSSMAVASIGPAAASSTAATAQDDPAQTTACDDLVLQFISIFGCDTGSEVEEIDDGDTTQTKIDLYVQGQTLYDGWESWRTVMDNYVQDTETIASLEAKHAIAQAYEDDETVSAAHSRAQSSIADYYAVKQINLLEKWSSQQAQLAYIADVAHNESDIPDNWAYGTIDTGGKDSTWVDNLLANRLTGDLTTHNITLANGTTHQYKSATSFIELESAVSDYDAQTGAGKGNWSMTLDHPGDGEYDIDQEFNTYGEPWPGGDSIGTITTTGTYRLSGVPESDGFHDERVFESQEWIDKWDELSQQSTTVTENYPDTFAQELFDELDAGNINVSEIYGAEGMARFLSGDDGDVNVTTDRLKMATISMLDLNRSELDSSMVIEYNAATEYDTSVDNTSGEKTLNYTWTEGTAEGLLFSGEVPDGGFAVNETYNVSSIAGTQLVVGPDGEETRFYKGEFTITAMFDDSGDAVENVSWDRPEYETYNATEIVEMLEEAQEERSEIVIENPGGGGGINWPDVGLPDVGTGGALAGIAIIAGALVASVVAVRTFTP